MPSHSGFCACPQGDRTSISHLLHTVSKRKQRENQKIHLYTLRFFFCVTLCKGITKHFPQPWPRAVRENKPLFLVSYFACDIVLLAVVNIPTQGQYWVFSLLSPQSNPMWQFLSINDEVIVWTQLIMITNSVSLLQLTLFLALLSPCKQVCMSFLAFRNIRHYQRYEVRASEEDRGMGKFNYFM